MARRKSKPKPETKPETVEQSVAEARLATLPTWARAPFLVGHAKEMPEGSVVHLTVTEGERVLIDVEAEATSVEP